MRDIHSNNLISGSFEELSHALRILAEADLRAHKGLLEIDRAEAVGNIETAFTSILNAFHSLYDACQKQKASICLDWYAVGELATILTLRNARHHNHARKIRTLYTYHVQENSKPTEMVSYVLVDFPALDPTARWSELYISWGDLVTLFSLLEKDTRLRRSTITLVRHCLGSEGFSSYAASYDAPVNLVFFNAFPLITNAAIKVVSALAEHIKPASMEAKTYFRQFSRLEPMQTDKPNVDCRVFALPR